MENKTNKQSRKRAERKVDHQTVETHIKPIAGHSSADLLAEHSLNDLKATKNVGKTLDPEMLDTIISHLRTSLEASFAHKSQKKEEPEPFQVLLDPESIQAYLEKAWDLDRFVLDNSFLYLLSLDPQLHRTDFRTLIFFKDGRLIKTRESSNNVMRSLFELIGFNYDFIRGISTRVNGKEGHCVPYIFGRYSFLPLSGPTRKQSSWINLSKVQHYRALKGEKGVEVHCENQHVFQLPVRPQFFAEKVKQAGQTIHRQEHFLRNVLKNFDYVDGRKEERENNLLGNAFHAHTDRISLISMEDYIRIFQFSFAETALRHPSLRDNPVTDEALHLLRENLYADLPHLRNAVR
ncbi:competence protein ComK [Trichococcus pasteurii]|uniref:Competence protein comk n=1 Tax=Trichococcus pasteurii TaxID=43064 RepID=A0A1W1IGS5_9LACT|nr:competence protein ComK [Trichococcus pasteurii]SFE65057.1 ComK protein [Trichococcus pasteurii]SLM52206.1 competence protein comk [Trichococcus pasteurii]SSB93087.1 competence protein comk [Trichococcus pasteurii]